MSDSSESKGLYYDPATLPFPDTQPHDCCNHAATGDTNATAMAPVTETTPHDYPPNFATERKPLLPSTGINNDPDVNDSTAVPQKKGNLLKGITALVILVLVLVLLMVMMMLLLLVHYGSINADAFDGDTIELAKYDNLFYARVKITQKPRDSGSLNPGVTVYGINEEQIIYRHKTEQYVPNGTIYQPEPSRSIARLTNPPGFYLWKGSNFTFSICISSSHFPQNGTLFIFDAFDNFQCFINYEGDGHSAYSTHNIPIGNNETICTEVFVKANLTTYYFPTVETTSYNVMYNFNITTNEIYVNHTDYTNDSICYDVTTLDICEVHIPITRKPYTLLAYIHPALDDEAYSTCIQVTGTLHFLWPFIIGIILLLVILFGIVLVLYICKKSYSQYFVGLSL